ncbi:MAG: S8 family serine peptidase [Vicingaceae bacterium]
MKNLFIKLLFSFLLLLVALQSTAQHKSKYGFELIQYLKVVDKNTMVPLLVEGKDENLNEYVQQFNGATRLQIGNLYSLEIPAKHVYAFSQLETVLAIQFSTSKGQALGDTMLININMDSVIQQAAPLQSNYTGKGVVLGVIDSGIELEHNDFKDSLGNTRIKYIWDQKVNFQPAHQANNYNYGVEWTASEIDSKLATHDDDPQQFGHGSNVTGAAASNGLATGNFRGVAPEVNIVSVATDFSKPNWLQTVVEAVDYIYSKADSMGMPCVINASIGTYVGSHDGKDIAARMIDSLISQKNGRAFVCAAGNAGNIPFHLQQQPQNDSSFTWFESNSNQWGGLGGLYFEFWADTADLKQLKFSIGADKVASGNYQFRGRTVFDSIQNRLNVIYDDSILNPQGNRIAAIKTYAEQNAGRYKVEVAIINPDSANYLFRLETAGTGKIDLWSSYTLFRHSQMKQLNLPSQAQFPAIANYVKPDSLQSIVSSFTCLPSVITVGNYTNRTTYTDVSNTLRTMPFKAGEISRNSSLGPTRSGVQKPDISSAGDFMFAAGRLATLASAIQTNPSKVSQDSLHFRNGGTSMASPTVAGMLALYFEQCPNSDYLQIAQDLRNTAKADQFTSSLPNNKWGDGKADAFQFLKKNAFSPTISGSTIACEGDTLLLSGDNPNYTYLWNNQQNGSSIAIDSSGLYFAYAENSKGCRSLTDTLQVQFIPLPTQPLINQNGNDLSLNRSGSFQWYLNHSLLVGKTDSVITATQSGEYYCIYTDSNTCSISSDTINLLITALDQHQQQNFKIYPNPTSGILNLQATTAQTIKSIELYDLAGRIVLSRFNNNKKQQLELNLSPLVKGVYFLRVYKAGGIHQQKIILQ